MCRGGFRRVFRHHFLVGGLAGDADVGARPELLLGAAAHRPRAVGTVAPVIAGHVAPLEEAVLAGLLGQAVLDLVHLVAVLGVELGVAVLSPGQLQHVLVQAVLRRRFVVGTDGELEVAEVGRREFDPDVDDAADAVLADYDALAVGAAVLVRPRCPTATKLLITNQKNVREHTLSPRGRRTRRTCPRSSPIVW